MIVVVLEAGTELQLRLGAEGLVLAPQTALQLTLGHVVVVVVPEHVLTAAEGLWFPAQARWLLLTGADPTWEISMEDGSAVPQGADRAAGAPHGPQPLSARPANAAPGARSSGHPNTLFLTPRYSYRAAAPRGSSHMPKPHPERHPLPAEFQLSLHGLEPLACSALRPLPPSPSPSPGPRAPPIKARPRPGCKARRRLFQH